jgi:hypothetical protein
VACFRSKNMLSEHIPRSGLLAIVLLAPPSAGSLAAQQGQQGQQGGGTPLNKDGAKPMPLHRPLTVFTPQDALRHLTRGNRLMLAVTRPARGQGRQPQPMRRPAGAGRHVAAVVQGIGYRRSPGEIFATRHWDLLTFSSPGPCIRNAEVAALEEAVQEDRLSLMVILVRPGDTALKPPEEHASPARRALWRHIEAAHKLAKAAGVSLAEAHGLMQAEVVWRLSPYLREQRQRERFRIAVGIVDTGTGGVQWVTRWHKAPPLLTPPPGR